MCGTAAILLLCVLFFARYRARVLKRSSRKCMLACAMFDPDGNIIVTTEGVLPAREITKKFNHRTFDEEFDTAHPVFHWMFRVTRNWSSVKDMIPRMKDHLGSPRENGGSWPSSSISSDDAQSGLCSEYAAAACQLSNASATAYQPAPSSKASPSRPGWRACPSRRWRQPATAYS